MENSPLFESWTYLSSDSVMYGKGYEIIKKDDTEIESVFEKLRIFRMNDTIFYGAKIGANETLFQFIPGKKTNTFLKTTIMISLKE